MDWFDKNISDQIYFPNDIEWTTECINKHFKHDTFQYNKPKIKLKESNTCKNNTFKKIKKQINYQEKIEELKKQIIETNDTDLIKKLNTRLKSYTTKYTKQTNNVNTITKVHTISIPFNDIQKEVLNKWFTECLKVYNACIDYNNTENKDKKLIYDYTKLKLHIFKEIYQTNKKLAPYDTLTDEVRLFCSNLKSCISNKEAGNINHFELKYRFLNIIQSIFISKKSITKSGIFPTILKEIEDWNFIYESILKNVKNIECDCRLIYDKLTDKYLLKIPYIVKCNETLKENRDEVVSLDPGEKIFMTYYSLDKCGRLGHDIRISILEKEKKIRRYQRILTHTKNKKSNKLKNKKHIKKKIQKKYRDISNLVKELHNQTANYLTNNYNSILIPSFETKNMISNKDKIITKRREIIKECKSIEEIKIFKRKSRLNSRVKFVLNSLQHYKFRQHLSNKCQEKGCQLFVVDESYTSQCCGKCGEISKIFSTNRVKKCDKCKVEIDRDINGARNILIKNWKIF
jgi:IS605 OrfB family transposase